MQPVETEFLYNFNLSQSEYINKYVKKLQVGESDQQLLEKSRTILLELMIETLEHWFRDTCFKDDNFFTFAEIGDIIEHANKIMDTTHRISLPTALTMEDYDENVYRITRIGNQEWMSENLRVLHYRDGEPIPNIIDSTDWQADTTGAYCWYNNDIINKDTYGALYNWYACTNVHNLAPDGWRVPTTGDFLELINYVGEWSDAGGLLKETTSMHWRSPNVEATDIYGFKATACGNRYCDTPVDPGFASQKLYGDFLSSEGLGPIAFSLWFEDDSGIAFGGTFDKFCGQNVRCVRTVI